jgi:hypothetical protein
MPSIQKNNRAAALLRDIREEDRLSIDRLALLIGLPVSALRACRDEGLVLEPMQQIQLAKAVAARIPRLAPNARRLGEQAAAAATVQDGSTALHLTAPSRWW